jgi:hypothetical protein
MNGNVDLDDALTFVVKRIEREATRSGKPLTEDEILLLNNLPTTPLFPLTGYSDPEFPPPMLFQGTWHETHRSSKRCASLRP